jgi:hypothetical protein
MSDGPAALADRIIANGQRNRHQRNAGANGNVSPNGMNYVQLPRHIVGMGARMNAFTPGSARASAPPMRTWWKQSTWHAGRSAASRLGNLQGPGHVTSLQFAPSLTYALPDAINNSFWVRPYVGRRRQSDSHDGESSGLGARGVRRARTAWAFRHSAGPK